MAGEMNLSLLSRGIGEIKKNGHEKIEVKLEPQDYYNWIGETDAGKRMWKLPPLPVAAAGPTLRRQDGGPSFDGATYGFAYIPKTFTTRKGALLLFSEDLAVKNMRKKRRRRRRLAHSADSVTFRTVDDLAKGILTYGGSTIGEESAARDVADSGGAASTKIYLGFIHSRGRKFYERQIKPGFSARRYLGSWSKLWDYSLLCRISEKGLLKQAVQTVTESGYAVKNDMDLSGIPMPYRILRQWLSSPRAMDEYAFYRAGSIPVDGDAAPPASAIKDGDRPAPMDTSSVGSAPGRLKVAAIVDLGGTVEINYSHLDMQAKEAVLTELLVKSAITQAIQKHMEYSEATAEGQDEAEAAARAMQFNLMDAVETLVTGDGSSSATGVGSVRRVARVELDADSVLPQAPLANSSLRGSKVPRSKGDASSKSSSVSWGGGDSDRGGVGGAASNPLPPITNALHRSARGGGGSKRSSGSASVSGDAFPQPLPPIGRQKDAEATDDNEPQSSPLTPPTSNLTVANSLPPTADESLSSEHHAKEDAEYSEWRKSSVDEEKLLAEANREASPLHRPTSSVSSVSHAAAEVASAAAASAAHADQPPRFDTSLPDALAFEHSAAPNFVVRGVSFQPTIASTSLTLLHSAAVLSSSSNCLAAESRASPPCATAAAAATQSPQSAEAALACHAANQGPDQRRQGRLHDPQKRSPPTNAPLALGSDAGDSRRSAAAASGGFSPASPADASTARRVIGSVRHSSMSSTTASGLIRTPSSSRHRSLSQSSRSLAEVPTYRLELESKQTPTSLCRATLSCPSLDLEGMKSLHDAAGEVEDHKSVLSHASHFSSRRSAATSATHNSESGAAVAWRDAGGQQAQGDFDPSDLMVSWSYRPPQPPAADASKLASAVGGSGPSSADSVSADSVSQHDGHDAAMDTTGDDVAEGSRTPSVAAAAPTTGDEAERSEPVSEQSVLDQLTEQASRVARVVLSGNAAGVDLTADANLAAELMSEVLSPAVLSRAQSISSYHSRISAAESAISEHLRRNSGLGSASAHDAEAASGHHGSSRGASRALGLSTASSAKASVAGENATNGDEAVSDVPLSRRSKPISRASGGVSSSVSSASVPGAAAAADSGGAGTTVPGQPGESDSSAATQQPVATTGEELRPAEREPQEKKRVEEEITAVAPQPLIVITNKETESGKGSVKSKKSNKSRKSQVDGRSKSEKGDAGAVAEVKEDPFVVGKVKDETELQKLYAPVEPPKSKPQKGPKTQKGAAEKKPSPATKEPAPVKKEAPPAAAAKGKKKAATKKSTKKDNSKGAAATESGPTAASVEPAAAPPVEEPTRTQPASAGSRAASEEEDVEENKPEEPEMEFIIHRDDDSDAGESDSRGTAATAEADDSAAASARPVKFDFRSFQSLQQSQDSEEDDEQDDGEEEEMLQNVSNKDARAAKQAAEKERRRQEVERRRREREEQLRREKEEAERRERVQQQLEEDRRRREEEKRLRKEQEEEEERRLDAEELEREQRRRDAEERERRREAEYQRHLADVRRRAEEEEARRRELAAQKAREEAELRRLEEEMLSKMALEERLEYERLKREEEERRLAAEEEARLRREEEARQAMEAARLLAEEAARQQEALRQRLLFQRGLNLEASGLDHAHDITRAFVFSYYELLQWLGVNVPNLAELVQWARSNSDDT